MLPPTVAQKVRQLLATLDPLDLADLAATCCSNLVQFDRNSVDDCSRVILAYSGNAAELLGRRKIKREYLIKYLWSSDIPVSLNVSKTEAVARLLDHWQLAVEHQQPDQQPQQPQQPHQPPDNHLTRLSDAFTRWFFEAYNSASTSGGGLPLAAFEPDCDFAVELGGPAMPAGCRVHREQHRSGQRACRGLAELVQLHGYALRPNLLPPATSGQGGSRGGGIHAERSSFGLVRLTVDCTLHHLASGGGACIGLARLHCILSPRLTTDSSNSSSSSSSSSVATTQGHVNYDYAIRGLRLLLYLESGAGVPACLRALQPPPQQQQLQQHEQRLSIAADAINR